MAHSFRIGVLSVVCLAGLFGCDDDDLERVAPVPLDQVPPAIMKVAQERAPDVKFDVALKGQVRGEEAYELRGKDKRGKACEIEVSASGKFLGRE